LGEIGEFALKHQLFLRTYRWRRIDPVPCKPLGKPLRESRVAVISSAGFVLPGQQPFDTSIRGGDPSFREIPADTDVSILVDVHRSETFDHADMRDDPNLVFPIDRMRELAARGRIGSVNRRHLSFMGGITAPGRLIKHTAPEAARQLVSDAVDAALLIPV
jgi:D-proline reductase (dithiol) PrdB